MATLAARKAGKWGTGYPDWLKPIMIFPLGLRVLLARKESLEIGWTTNGVCDRYSGRPYPRAPRDMAGMNAGVVIEL